MNRGFPVCLPCICFLTLALSTDSWTKHKKLAILTGIAHGTMVVITVSFRLCFSHQEHNSVPWRFTKIIFVPKNLAAVMWDSGSKKFMTCFSVKWTAYGIHVEGVDGSFIRNDKARIVKRSYIRGRDARYSCFSWVVAVASIANAGHICLG